MSDLPDTGPKSWSETDQRVFYQILENTARTAEEVASLRREMKMMHTENNRLSDRIDEVEDTVENHALLLKIATTLGGLATAGFFTYIWTLV
jgi:hypothetical protein